MATTEANSADLKLAEDCMLSSWPALKVAHSGSWVLRMAGGASGRANSVTILDPADDGDLDERISWVEQTYSNENLKSAFRATPLSPPSLVSALTQRGYVEEDHTAILQLKLRAETITRPTKKELKILEFNTASDEWLDFFCATNPRYEACRETFQAMMRSCADPTLFSLAKVGGVPAAALMFVVHRTCFTVHNVITHADFRQRGIGHALMLHGLEWAKSQGATWGWIGVLKSNAPALSLYEKLGAQPFSQYCYMRKPIS